MIRNLNIEELSNIKKLSSYIIDNIHNTENSFVINIENNLECLSKHWNGSKLVSIKTNIKQGNYFISAFMNFKSSLRLVGTFVNREPENTAYILKPVIRKWNEDETRNIPPNRGRSQPQSICNSFPIEFAKKLLENKYSATSRYGAMFYVLLKNANPSAFCNLINGVIKNVHQFWRYKRENFDKLVSKLQPLEHSKINMNKLEKIHVVDAILDNTTMQILEDFKTMK